MCKSNYKHVEFNLTQLEFRNAFNGLEMHSTDGAIINSKNGQSIYNGKIFGQFGERSTKLNAYTKAIW